MISAQAVRAYLDVRHTKMKKALLIFVLCVSLSSKAEGVHDAIEETDFKELLNDNAALDTFEYVSNSQRCFSLEEIDTLIRNDVRKVDGNALLYLEYHSPSMFRKCADVKVAAYSVDNDAKIFDHKNLVSIANRQRYAAKFASGYSSGSYFILVGAEYILPYIQKIPITHFIMPSAYLINREAKRLDFQIAAPTIFGVIDGYVIKNIYGDDKENRFGVKIDGGFLITESLSGPFPNTWFKHGRGLNYHMTIQPYLSYTFPTKHYDSEFMAGVVITKWLNPDGLVICCK